MFTSVARFHNHLPPATVSGQSDKNLNSGGIALAELQEAAHPFSLENPYRSMRIAEFNPLEHLISTRPPARYDVPTAWMGHIPFAMALISMVKPRILVELGTHWGVSYCAFCQAIKELRLATKCYAIDIWKGYPHAGFYSDDVFENLRTYHDERYSLFSQLVRSTFDDALDRFDPNTIDVLHIDGYHTYDAVKHDFEIWLPKMTDRGIVLFHDIDVRDQESFGVWRFWDEVKQKYPYFEFYHCYGLGVLAVGETIPEGICTLIGRPTNPESIRKYFANLGDYLQELHVIAMQQANLAELLDAKTKECARLETDHAAAICSWRRITQRISRLETDHAAAICRLETDHAAAICRLETDHAAAICRLETDHTAAISRVKTDHAAAISRLETELAVMRTLLGRIRYRVVDRVARAIGNIPYARSAARLGANAIIRLARKSTRS
jgi:Methyltransferase domain